MSDNTATIVLESEVSLEEFAKVIHNFDELVRSLSDESGASLDPVIDDLNVGSATATIAGSNEKVAKPKPDASCVTGEVFWRPRCSRTV